MLILGIESTCDETAAAVVEDGLQIRSNVVASQIELHQKYGGVVPELASREHLVRIGPVVRQACEEAGVTMADLDAIAVAQGPGLVGALLVGLNTAKGLAMGLGKPLIGINHIEAHLYAAVMSQPDQVAYPALGVVISGGHTALFKMTGVGQYELLGSTVDDAIGEAFDKVASLMGLPYPGGPAIEQLAKQGDPEAFLFHAGRVKGRPLDFSFSGLKTTVLYALKGQSSHRDSPLILPEERLPDVAASFQRAALSDIVSKSLLAAQEASCKCILLGGGVSNNRELRHLFAEQATLPTLWPAPALTLDNGAMIAGLAFHKEKSEGWDLPPRPRMSIA